MCETVQAGAAHPQNLPAFCLSDRCPTAPGDETVTLPDFIGNCRCGSQQAHQHVGPPKLNKSPPEN